jgi:hypothetical protein
MYIFFNYEPAVCYYVRSLGVSVKSRQRSSLSAAQSYSISDPLSVSVRLEGPLLAMRGFADLYSELLLYGSAVPVSPKSTSICV